MNITTLKNELDGIIICDTHEDGSFFEMVLIILILQVSIFTLKNELCTFDFCSFNLCCLFCGLTFAVLNVPPLHMKNNF